MDEVGSPLVEDGLDPLQGQLLELAFVEPRRPDLHPLLLVDEVLLLPIAQGLVDGLQEDHEAVLSEALVHFG